MKEQIMKKLFGLIIGLMVSVSVFADAREDRINKASEQVQKKFQNILSQCYMNNFDDDTRTDKLTKIMQNFSTASNKFIEYVETADRQKRVEKIVADDYMYAKVDNYIYELEIKNDEEVIISITTDDYFGFGINANGGFAASR